MRTFLAVARPANESGRNYLDVANIDGTYVIRAFDAGMLGESFAFGVTKSVKSKALRASAESRHGHSRLRGVRLSCSVEGPATLPGNPLTQVLMLPRRLGY